MTDISIRSFVDAAQSAQNLDDNIVADTSKKSKVDGTTSTAPPRKEKLDDKQLEELTKSVENNLKKLGIGKFVDRQLVKLKNSGINEADCKQLESLVVLNIAYDCSRSDFNPFESENFTEGFIQEYNYRKISQKVSFRNTMRRKQTTKSPNT